MSGPPRSAVQDACLSLPKLSAIHLPLRVLASLSNENISYGRVEEACANCLEERTDFSLYRYNLVHNGHDLVFATVACRHLFESLLPCENEKVIHRAVLRGCNREQRLTPSDCNREIASVPEALHGDSPRLTCPLATANISAKTNNVSFQLLDLCFLCWETWFSQTLVTLHPLTRTRSSLSSSSSR